MEDRQKSTRDEVAELATMAVESISSKYDPWDTHDIRDEIGIMAVENGVPYGVLAAVVGPKVIIDSLGEIEAHAHLVEVLRPPDWYWEPATVVV